MPFGLKHAPETFQYAMDFILFPVELKQAQAYLVNIVLFSGSWSKNIAQLRQVLHL